MMREGEEDDGQEEDVYGEDENDDGKDENDEGVMEEQTSDSTMSTGPANAIRRKNV